MQKLLSTMRRAIGDYNMIKDGDHIAVGVSGGKDSLTLLTALKAYQRFSPESFELSAITVDLGFKGTDQNEVKALIDYTEKLGVPYYIVPTDIGEILFDVRKESNPCSLCSKMRRGALNNKAKEIGANKIALGHHADDVIQTIFLSLFYEGRFSSFAPTAYMDRSGIELIRPFIYVWEKDLKSVVAKLDLPVLNNVCPANKHTQREYINLLIKDIQKDVPFVKERMLGAIQHPERANLWPEYQPYVKLSKEERDQRLKNKLERQSENKD